MQKYASVPRLLAALQGSGMGGVLARGTPSPAVAELASSLADAAPSPLLGILRRSPFLATFATSPLAKAPLGLPPLQGSYVQAGAASQQVAAKAQNFAKTDTRAMSGHASGVASEAIGMTDGEAVKRAALPGLMLTIALGLVFTCCQAFEYWEAALTIADGYYGTAFYMATGFHGLHVIMGTVFLIITAVRMSRGQFAPSHHVGFQLAAWYWHFVDVVWLFVLVSFYDF